MLIFIVCYLNCQLMKAFDEVPCWERSSSYCDCSFVLCVSIWRNWKVNLDCELWLSWWNFILCVKPWWNRHCNVTVSRLGTLFLLSGHVCVAAGGVFVCEYLDIPKAVWKRGITNWTLEKWVSYYVESIWWDGEEDIWDAFDISILF